MIAFGDPRLPTRFWEKVRINPESGCWEWTAGIKGVGYGAYRFEGKQCLAHRVAYEVLVGSAAGLKIDHTCHRRGTGCPGGADCMHRRCVNPAHLEAVSQRENLLRGLGFPASQAARMECPQGHPYAGGNLRIDADGARRCRACEQARQKAYRKRQKELKT